MSHRYKLLFHGLIVRSFSDWSEVSLWQRLTISQVLRFPSQIKLSLTNTSSVILYQRREQKFEKQNKKKINRKTDNDNKSATEEKVRVVISHVRLSLLNLWKMVKIIGQGSTYSGLWDDFCLWSWTELHCKFFFQGSVSLFPRFLLFSCLNDPQIYIAEKLRWLNNYK